jgi:hypothetical protein
LENAQGLIVLVLIIGLVVAYHDWKTKGIRPRRVSTLLDEQTLRDIFAKTVATTGWRIIDDANPIIAQSTALSGIRQQIALELNVSDDGRTEARIAVVRYSKKALGGATKAYTLMWRIKAFMDEMQSLDASATVAE